MICRYLKASERVKMWESVNGPIPQGKIIGTTCHVPYCGKMEHMVVAERRNNHWHDWKQYTNKMHSLEVGEYAEFDIPCDLKLFRTNIAARNAMSCFSIRTAPNGKRVRIYKTGSWDDRESAEAFSSSLPVMWTHIAERIGKHPPIYFFGFLGGSLGSVMHRREAETLMRPCEVRACPFPRNGSPLCHRHKHFFEYSCSMKGQIDRGDLFSEDRAKFPLFTTMQPWEITHSFERTKFWHRGTVDQGTLLSEEWWKANVERAINGQWSGPHGHKGWGKKKIRKAQRMRPAGYHGSRPAQKPIKVERDTLDNVAQWTPQRTEELELVWDEPEDFFIDDDTEREELIASIEEDFAEVFA